MRELNVSEIQEVNGGNLVKVIVKAVAKAIGSEVAVTAAKKMVGVDTNSSNPSSATNKL